MQLTPLTSSSSATAAPRNDPRNYLNALPPTLATLQTGLAIFALFIIGRYCTRRVYAWLRRDRVADSFDSPILLRHQQQSKQQHQQQNPFVHAPWAMDEKHGLTGNARDSEEHGQELVPEQHKPMSIDPNWSSSDSLPRSILARPPPAPPLTPPELSTGIFSFEGRQGPATSSTASGDSFINQPNPDYMGSTSSTALPDTTDSSSIPRRRSYNRTLPIGVPVSRSSSLASDPADPIFSPSSYPPTNPLLPPAPPNAGATEIDVKGEIIGVLDGDGAGWTRHTRVYGGGVCLACLASGGDHKTGGFYGATVPPEEMR